MRRNYSKIKFKTVLMTALIIIIFSFVGGGVGVVNAATSTYSNVLTDLRKDESFNVSDYPESLKDYSISVIHIAESESGELYLYTYQPSGQFADLKATCISLSTSANDSYADDAARWLLYELEFLNSNGVFFKYKVNGFTVSSESERYYNIASIFRKWIDGVDKETGNTDTITETVFSVNKLFIVETIDGALKYSCK
ncbi:MAG: hypothetical protein NC311_15040, partial [Muribaculaceae bacterium]|nr:hypothetical protein [Muribaculaceae bacterium]